MYINVFTEQKKFKNYFDLHFNDTWEEEWEITDQTVSGAIEYLKDILSSKVDEIKIFVKGGLRKRIFKYKLKSSGIKRKYKSLNKLIFFWENKDIITITYQPWL